MPQHGDTIPSLLAAARAGRRVTIPKSVLVWAGRAVATGAIAYIAVELDRIGWREVWAALPGNPGVLALFALMYLALPVSEMVIFGRLWNAGGWALFLALLRKRALNESVLGYSGDAAFLLWAQRRLDMPAWQLFLQLKDSAILSAVAATLVAVAVLGAFLGFGRLRLPVDPNGWTITQALCFLFLPALGLSAAMIFRRRLISIPRSLARFVFTMHLARFMAVQGLQVAVWAAALPQVPLATWLAFLSAQIIVTRIPFLPGASLIFVGAGINLAHLTALAPDAVAGMLIGLSALQFGAHAICLLLAEWPARTLRTIERESTAS